MRIWERDTGWVLHVQNAISASSAVWILCSGFLRAESFKMKWKKYGFMVKAVYHQFKSWCYCSLSQFCNYALKQKLFFLFENPAQKNKTDDQRINSGERRNSLRGNRLMTSVKALNIYLQSNNVSLWSFTFQPNATDFSRSLKKTLFYPFRLVWSRLKCLYICSYKGYTCLPHQHEEDKVRR